MLKEIKYNIPLKAAIDERGLKLVWVAAKIGIDPGLLTNIISGRRAATKAQKESLAELFECSVSDLFKE